MEFFRRGRLLAWRTKVRVAATAADKTVHREKEIWVPVRLHVATNKDDQGRKKSVAWLRKKVAKQILVPVRNGHYYGWKASHKGISRLMLQGGLPRLDGPNQVYQWYSDQLKQPVSFMIEIFETPHPAEHFWMPERAGYKVLWKKTYSFEAPQDNETVASPALRGADSVDDKN